MTGMNHRNPREIRRLREVIGILMESTFYLELPLRERYGLVCYLLNR